MNAQEDQIWASDQVWRQDHLMSAKFLFHAFMDKDNTKKELNEANIQSISWMNKPGQ